MNSIIQFLPFGPPDENGFFSHFPEDNRIPFDTIDDLYNLEMVQWILRQNEHDPYRGLRMDEEYLFGMSSLQTDKVLLGKIEHPEEIPFPMPETSQERWERLYGNKS